MSLSKESVRLFVEGHKTAEKVIKEEKKKRLAHLTRKESLLEYDSLCQIWESASGRVDTDRLDKQKIAFLVKRRALLDKVGGRK